MNRPAVSICLPNLRNRAYLPERIDSIIAQTFTDWELVVFDNLSDDGAWEYLCERAKSEPRMRVQQAPREGMYANWNNCIRAARGESIYIATSDDNMAPDCLEKLYAALKRYDNCDVAHCPAYIFGTGADAVFEWWRRESPLAKSLGGDLTVEHIRRAPMDGLLHASGHTVITSITQALIRRSAFDKVGYFPNDCGVVGDFAWHALSGLMLDSVFVPDTWGGWRQHRTQATAMNPASGAEKIWLCNRLFRRALSAFCESETRPEVRDLAELTAAISYVSAVHRSSYGGSMFLRSLRVASALVAQDLVPYVIKWGPRRTLRNIKDPVVFVMTEIAERSLASVD